jgi:hypothetical protein
MAVERGLGSGGLPEAPMIPEQEMLQNVIDLPAQPGVTEFDDGSAIIGEYEEDQPPVQPVPFDGNLADVIDEGELGRISSDLVNSIEDDLAAREDWEDTYKRGLEFLGMKTEERSEPFEGSSGVIHPLLAESVTQFQAQAYRELLPATGPVRTAVVGAQNEMLVKQSERVKDYMNYMITYEMEEYDPELDQMLFYLPVIGSTFKKVYFDPLKGRAVSKFIHAEDLIVPYGATDLLSSPRITHRITMDSNEVRKLQLNGFYRDIDLPSESESDTAAMSEVEESIDDVQGIHPSGPSDELTLYEVHTSLDIEGFEDMGVNGEPTGLRLPYIVTVVADSGDVLAIRRNYLEIDPMKRAKQYFVHYKFLPGLGFYGLGLTHMIGGLAQASTSILRQLIDAGTLSNLPAGFKARGARIRDEDNPLQPGEFRDIDVVGGTLQGSLMPLPFKEPSGTLYNLLGTLVDAGRRFASMADMKVGEMSGETPVGTTMAIMERGTKVMSAIQAPRWRLWSAAQRLCLRFISVCTILRRLSLSCFREYLLKPFRRIHILLTCRWVQKCLCKTLISVLMCCRLLTRIFSLCRSVLLWRKLSCSWFSPIRRFTVVHKDYIRRIVRCTRRWASITSTRYSHLLHSHSLRIHLRKTRMLLWVLLCRHSLIKTMSPT